MIFIRGAKLLHFLDIHNNFCEKVVKIWPVEGFCHLFYIPLQAFSRIAHPLYAPKLKKRNTSDLNKSMINRELIRIKAVQLTYAYFQNASNKIDSAEKELVFSLSKSYHLYKVLLLLIVAVTRMARKRYEVAKARTDREGGTRPSGKFAFNKFAEQLESNLTLKEYVEEAGDIWAEKQEFVTLKEN